MMNMTPYILFSFFFVLLFSKITLSVSSDIFLQCFSHSSRSSNITFTQNNSSYTSILLARIDNLRFATPSTPKPVVIVTPVDESQIQAVIYCAKKSNLQIRIRDGGHDFEGQSYRATEPFLLLDLINFRSVKIDTKNALAWVGAGLTLGELYYRISQRSRTLGFPAGLWSTVGVSGFLGGGGYGMMKRKYGLAGDNTLDVRFIDVHGRILNRKSMGEDLFWAIRGGGVSSYGIVTSWKIKLVPVPKVVTIFGVARTLEQNGAKLFQEWQTISPNFESRDLDVRAVVDTIQSNSSSRKDKKTVRFIFQSLFLGRINKLLPIMQKSFPQLGLVREDCVELSWIQSAPFFSNFSITTPPEILLNRSAIPRYPYKGKSSFVDQPISSKGLQGVWDRMLQLPTQVALIQYTPFGGIMNEFSESSLPFPHRPGVLYMINIGITLDKDVNRRLRWINELFSYYAPFVTKNPRTSYVNYIDLDLGTGNSSYEEASMWGKMYFKNNFKKLIKVKSAVDPNNFFRHQQSIPALFL
ncbi:Berberine bridge enzyme [Heracleum sosnowskyi]|uniref:Berberine bridge enzyme n=1 Tax=Heracleum sosnowskyi TaxID=360622 RepID=A0AAD8LZK9_9APIA|nr:Berberine bridge enzyme [Heracleum sosnowskyi]